MVDQEAPGAPTALEFGVEPDDQLVPCCSDAAYSDGRNCTCWEVEIAEPQQPILEGPVNVRRKACDDCAYRSGSVERDRGEEPNPAGGLIFCHRDAPAVVRSIHPPTGHTIEYSTRETYDPVQHGNRFWKADGRPQDYCAVSGAITAVRRTPVSADSGTRGDS